MSLPRMETWQVTVWVMAAAQVITQAAFNLSLPFMPLYLREVGVRDVHAAAVWAGVLASASSLMMAIMAPIWGRISDKRGRKAMVLRATIGSAITVGLMGAVTSPQQLLVLRLAQGLVTGTVPATAALVSSVVPLERLGSSLGLVQTAVFVGAAAGPLLGGITADNLGYRLTFLLTGVVMIAAAALVGFGAQEPKRKPAPAREGPAVGPAARPSFLRSGVAQLVVVNFLDAFATSAVAPILTLFIASLAGRDGASPANVATLAGTVLGVVSVSASLSAVVAGRMSDRYGPQRVIIVCAFGAALFSGLQALAGTVLVLAALRVLMGAFIGGTIPSANALLSLSTPEHARGAAFGYASSAASLGFSAGPIVGSLVSGGSLRLPFLVTAVLLAAEGFWVSRLLAQGATKPAA